MKTVNWNKEFPVITITRQDLVSVGFSQDQVGNLTDEIMANIASKMSIIHSDRCSWEDGYEEDLMQSGKEILDSQEVNHDDSNAG